MRVLPIILLALVFCGCDGAHSSPPAVTTGPRFLALGDSYTIGESVDPADRWPMQLARMLREQKTEIADPQIIATTGWTTDELMSGIDRADPKGPFSLVTVLIGTNNQFRGRSIDEFRVQFTDVLKRAIHLAGDNPKRVIVLSSPDWGATPYADGKDRAKIHQELIEFNRVCGEEAQKLGAAYIDIMPFSEKVLTDGNLVAGDGLHPSGKLYQMWAEATVQAAKKALSER